MVVKPQKRPCQMRSPQRALLAPAILCAAALLATMATATEPAIDAGLPSIDAGLSIGSPADAIDDARGRPVACPVRRPEATEAPLRACSFSLPLCTHAPRGTPAAAILAALEEAERVLRVYDAL